MSYSNTVTQEDLKNVLNEVLPTPRYGGVQTASWTANSSNANNVKLTDSIHLTAGTYVITVKYPGISATLSTAIQYGTGTLLDSFCLSAGAAYSSHSYVINIPSELDIFVATSTSSSITYTYKDRGGLRAIQISESRISDNEADYIVEQGTSGIWTYRKWNSGIAECWGKDTQQTKVNNAWGSMYVSTTFTVSFPTDLFNAPPVTQIYASGGYLCLINNGNSTPTKDVATYGLFRATAVSTTETYYAHIHAIGTWK